MGRQDDSVLAMHHFYKSVSHQYQAHGGAKPKFMITGIPSYSIHVPRARTHTTHE